MTIATATRPTRDRIDAFVGGLGERLADLVTLLDRDRQLPDDLVAEMRDAGLFRMFTPQEYGGLEMHPLAAAEVVERLARIEGSIAWCAMIGSQSAWFPMQLEPESAREILEPPGTIVAGAFKPGGRAVRVEGGYRVSGKWPFASGCMHATWLYGTCVVENPDEPSPARKTPVVRAVYVPAKEAQILDTWHTTGLRGTGSHDFVLRDVFVPKERALSLLPEPRAGESRPLYRDAVRNLVFVCQAGHALGLAQAALDAFRELASSRVRWASTIALQEEPTVRAEVARTWAEVQSARAWLFAVTEDLWDTIVGGSAPTMEQRIALRLAITHAITTSVAAGATLYRMAGTVVVYEGHQLARIHHDLEALGAHVQATPKILEITGGFLLGDAVDVSATLA
jgi:indole-3-acetate monooxygenase